MLFTKLPLSPMDLVSKRALVAVAAGMVVTAGSGLGAKNLAGSGPSSSTAPAVSAQASARGAAESDAARHRAVFDQYCVTCHNDALVSGADDARSPLVAQLCAAGISLDTMSLADIARDAADWERVVRKLRAGVMPPAGRPRPDEATLDALVAWLEAELDLAAAADPDPGRTATLHRLNRAEYQNAIHDLLAVEIDIVDHLPADDSSYGFDNIGGVLRMSEALLERYLDAARTVSRMAVGAALPAPQLDVYRSRQDLQQHDRIDGLPFGTRGGMSIDHFFPQNAEYAIDIVVQGARRLDEPHPLEVSIDGEQVALFAFEPSRTRVGLRVPVTAGPHAIDVVYHGNPRALAEEVREPFPNPTIEGNAGGPGGLMPFVDSVTVSGPFGSAGSGRTPSRDRVFVCRPLTAADEEPCARSILSTLARRAYRGQQTDDDVDVLLDFYRAGRLADGDDGGSFDDGIELALRRLLVSPQFLFRIEAPPPGLAPGTRYRVGNLALASRLSFFLWSSIPDDELLDVAEQGRLGEPVELERQVRRMVTDPRAAALTRNFVGQWLQLRNLTTDARPGFPYSLAFDETLRRGLLRETELFVDSIVRENRSVLELLTADYTFLNERVAEHYGLPDVQGSHFRRVSLSPDSPRRGLLGHGSILTVTSHAIRTSPVLRGKWVLDNVLGTPPPDPPPNVPALVDRRTQAKMATMRERMAAHRTNPSCAACHNLIDPAGFALERFDAIGRWRTVDESFNTLDTTGALPDGTTFDGVAGLRAALVRKPRRFVTTVTEKLLTYALGRGLEHYDMPAVREIIDMAAADEYRFQTVVLGVVRSYPFLNRR